MALQLSEIIDQARRIVGAEKDSIVGEIYMPDEAVEALLEDAIVEINAVAGTTDGRGEARFTTTANQQDYVISTVVGSSNVQTIEEVVRQAAMVADEALFGVAAEVDPLTGRPIPFSPRSLLFPDGLQGLATDAIAGQFRANHQDQFDFEVTADQKLRLYPVPRTSTETVVVFYTKATAGVESLPDRASTAIRHAACVALLDGMLNRLNSVIRDDVRASERVADVRFEAIQAQRDRFEGKYQEAVKALQRG